MPQIITIPMGKAKMILKPWPQRGIKNKYSKFKEEFPVSLQKKTFPSQFRCILQGDFSLLIIRLYLISEAFSLHLILSKRKKTKGN